MVRKVKKLFLFFVLLILILFFYYPFFVFSRLPIPLDAAVGLYHPYRDFYAGNNPNGIAYKNFLITDPVRQTFIWKELSIELLSKRQLPLWNPYEMTGKPLLGNFQSGALYPLNIVLLLQPFYLSWSFFIVLQSILMGIFMYLYLRNLRLSSYSSVIGAISLTFSGFSVAWLEWGTIVHTALWLPLILLAKDKMLDKKSYVWAIVLIAAETFAFLGGHLQTFFYIVALSSLYLLLRLILIASRQKNRRVGFFIKNSFPFIITSAIVLLFSLVQLLPTLQFISLSSRTFDQLYTQAGWFVPYHNLVQFIVPDFFGNPATLNYFGVWNYAEFVGYIGVGSFMLAVSAVLFRHDKKAFFYTGIIAVAVLFMTDNPISRLPYIFNIPFISQAQPTRLIFVIVFALSVLAALGMESLNKSRKIIFIPLLITGVIFAALWGIVVLKLYISPQNLPITASNLRLPTILLLFSSIILLAQQLVQSRKAKHILIGLFVLLLAFDLLRFGWKFTPFVSPEYLYPRTKAIEFLKKDNSLFRVASLDRQIMPPNFFTHYKIQTIEGYDPLYLFKYAQVIAANEREQHTIEPPFGYNRIITPQKYDTQLFDFLNVKYILSFNEIDSPKLTKVFEEGKTKIYKNESAFERIYFVKKVKRSTRPGKELFNNDLHEVAYVVEASDNEMMSPGKVTKVDYAENIITFETQNNGDGFLVFSDAYYPTWEATIDNEKTKIYETNLAFRGIFVPSGNHVIQFKNNLF